MFFLMIAATFFFMEFVAWFTHKYVMHGFLWTLHKDHHVKTPEQRKSFFERNDSFFVIFAVPGFCFILLGTLFGFQLLLPIGIGISIYGLAYFLVHDIFIHQRIKVLRNSNNMYLKAARRAHKMHHKHITKEDGECFGMLFFPLKYLKKELKTE